MTPHAGTATAGPRDPRERLVRAGRELVDELPLSKVFAGATTARVAAAAGVTTGSFFHHFPSHADYVDAMAMSVLDQPDPAAEAIEHLPESLGQMDLLELMRLALIDTWRLYRSQPDFRRQLRFEHQLWAHHEQPMSSPGDGLRTVGDVLRNSHQEKLDAAVEGWSQLLETAGRALVEPFDLRRVGVALTGLFDGLLVIEQLDPEAVDDEMFADVAITLARALTVPLGSRLRLADLVEPWERPDLSPQARSGARRRRQTRARIVEAATGLFASGWESVPASDIAEAAGVSHQTVLNLFGSVREVAASTFVRHMNPLRDLAAEVADDQPMVALHQLVGRLIELAASDPEPARALLTERARLKLQVGGEFAEMDVRIQVPLAEVLLPPLERMDVDAAELIPLVGLLIDTALSLAIDRAGHPGDAAALAMRLLPPSATGVHHWTPPRGTVT